MIPDLLWPTVITACVFILLIAYGLYRNSKARRETRKELEKIREDYYTAAAGTPSHEIPVKEESIPTKYTRFRNYEGQIINSKEYLHFIVKGDSMQFCGINNNDLIFVKKNFTINDLCSFPLPIVIHRDNAPSNETQYKVRRAWGLCEIEKCEDLIKKVLTSEKFNEKISVNDFFDGEKAMLEDFLQVRLKVYKDKYINCDDASDAYKNVVVSTTFHTDTKKIRFSLHPVSEVVGIVSESFTTGCC